MRMFEANGIVTPILQMPQMLQTVLLAAGVAATASWLIFGCVQARKYRSLLPPLFVIAGFVNSLLEAPVTYLGHVVHAQIGQITLYEALNRSIPWHIGLIYAAFFAPTFMLIYGRFRERTLTTGFIWTIFVVTMILNYILEIIPVHEGVWVYYDPQALWLWRGTHPLFWTFLNAGCAIFSATLIVHLLPKLTGWKQCFVLLVSPVGAFMGHFGAGFPFYIAANSNWGTAAIQVSGVASVILCILIVKISAEHMVSRQTSNTP